jgi:hypothetical protein
MLKHATAIMVALAINFNSFPLTGSCQALILFHVRAGSYGDTNLDGLDFINAVSWPKAIHEGYDTAQLFVTDKASEEQRQALINIVSGQEKGDGPLPDQKGITISLLLLLFFSFFSFLIFFCIFNLI